MIVNGVSVDLRSRALYGLVGIVILTAGILALLSFTVILGNYQDLESDHVRGEMNLIGNNIAGEIKNLESDAPDWAAWDDTYAFVRGEQPEFPQVNLVNATFRTLRVNFIVITDTEGGIRYGQGYDLAADVPLPLRADLAAELARDRAADLVTGKGNGSSGFLSLPEGPVLLASSPILHSDYSGPVQGAVILGRYVNDPEIRLLTEGTNLSLAIRPADSLQVSPAALAGAGETAVVVQPLDEQQVEGVRLVRDIYGNDTLLMSLRLDRAIYQQGKETIFFFLGLQLGIILIAGLLALVFLDRMVFARMHAISADITGITRKWDLSARIHTSGNDEITRLAAAANRMLDQIEEKHTALSESEERYAAMVNNAPEPVLTLRDGIIVFVNDTGVRLSGYTRGEIMGRGVLEFLTERSQQSVIGAQQTRTGENNVSSYEVEFVRKDGRIINLIVRAIDIRYHGEEVTLAILVDITERKAAEEALRQVNRKLNLLSGITRHDIKNQLMILYGYLDISRQSLGDAARMAGFIDREKRVADTLSRLINFTKDYEELGMKSPAWQNVCSLIEKVTPLLPMRSIRVDAGDPGLEVFADPLLEKVFYNLIDNALRYGGEQMTAIRVTHREEGGNLILTVEDDGAGISAEDKPRLFTKGFGKNTGHGLFLSREILAITGITITENGEAGKGARFELTVPKGAFRITPGRQPE